MSTLEGDFKAKFMYAETSKKDSTTPYVRAVFGLLAQNVDGEWVQLDIENTIASYTYWMGKDTPEWSDETSLERSQKLFKKHWDRELSDFTDVDQIREAFRDVEKSLKLKADASDFHKVQYINNLSNRKKEDHAELADLF